MNQDNGRNDTTVSQAVEEYRWAVASLSEKTQENYMRALDEFEKWAVQEDIKLGDIRPVTIRRYQAYLTERGNRHGGKLSTRSIQDYIRFIKVWLRWCSREEGLDQCVSDRTANSITLPSTEKKVMEVFTQQELDSILAATMRNPTDELQVRDFAIVCLLIDSGIRCGELVGLTLDQVHVHPGSESYIRVDGKTGEREVGIGLRASKAINRYVGRYRRNNTLTERHVFVSRQGTPLTTNTLHQIIERLCGWAGIDGSPHKFRRTFAVASLECGVDLFSVQRAMGHSNTATTSIYLSCFTSRQARHQTVSILDKMGK